MISYLKRTNGDKKGLVVGYDQYANLLHFSDYSYSNIFVEQDNKALFLYNDYLVSPNDIKNIKKYILDNFDNYDNIIYIKLKGTFLSLIMDKICTFLKKQDVEII